MAQVLLCLTKSEHHARSMSPNRAAHAERSVDRMRTRKETALGGSELLWGRPADAPSALRAGGLLKSHGSGSGGALRMGCSGWMLALGCG